MDLNEEDVIVSDPDSDEVVDENFYLQRLSLTQHSSSVISQVRNHEAISPIIPILHLCKPSRRGRMMQQTQGTETSLKPLSTQAGLDEEENTLQSEGVLKENSLVENQINCELQQFTADTSQCTVQKQEQINTSPKKTRSKRKFMNDKNKPVENMSKKIKDNASCPMFTRQTRAKSHRRKGFSKTSSHGSDTTNDKTRRNKATTFSRRNRFGETKLHVAVMQGDVQAVKDMIKLGVSINVKDNAGWTPLHEAVYINSYIITHMLLKAGAQVNCRGDNGITPLYDAKRHSFHQIVDLLLKYRADPSLVPNKSETPVDLIPDSSKQPPTETHVTNDEDEDFTGKSHVVLVHDSVAEDLSFNCDQDHNYSMSEKAFQSKNLCGYLDNGCCSDTNASEMKILVASQQNDGAESMDKKNIKISNENTQIEIDFLEYLLNFDLSHTLDDLKTNKDSSIQNTEQSSSDAHRDSPSNSFNVNSDDTISLLSSCPSDLIESVLQKTDLEDMEVHQALSLQQDSDLSSTGSLSVLLSIINNEELACFQNAKPIPEIAEENIQSVSEVLSNPLFFKQSLGGEVKKHQETLPLTESFTVADASGRLETHPNMCEMEVDLIQQSFVQKQMSPNTMCLGKNVREEETVITFVQNLPVVIQTTKPAPRCKETGLMRNLQEPLKTTDKPLPKNVRPLIGLDNLECHHVYDNSPSTGSMGNPQKPLKTTDKEQPNNGRPLIDLDNLECHHVYDKSPSTGSMGNPQKPLKTTDKDQPNNGRPLIDLDNLECHHAYDNLPSTGSLGNPQEPLKTTDKELPNSGRPLIDLDNLKFHHAYDNSPSTRSMIYLKKPLNTTDKELPNNGRPLIGLDNLECHHVYDNSPPTGSMRNPQEPLMTTDKEPPTNGRPLIGLENLEYYHANDSSPSTGSMRNPQEPLETTDKELPNNGRPLIDLDNLESHYVYNKSPSSLCAKLDETPSRDKSSVEDDTVNYSLDLFQKNDFSQDSLRSVSILQHSSVKPLCVNTSVDVNQVAGSSHHMEPHELMESKELASPDCQLSVQKKTAKRKKKKKRKGMLVIQNKDSNKVVKIAPNDLHKKNAAGESCLHLACRRPNVLRVKCLIEAGIDVNTMDNAGRTALYWACARGLVDVVVWLLEAGADVSNGCKLLCDAAAAGKYEVVKLLLQCGVSPRDGNTLGQNAEDLAADCRIKELLLTFNGPFRKPQQAETSKRDSQIPPGSLSTEVFMNIRSICLISDEEFLPIREMNKYWDSFVKNGDWTFGN